MSPAGMTGVRPSISCSVSVSDSDGRAAGTSSVTHVLEVWDTARDPFDAVAEYLEDAGFYGGTQPADVYFGYGISDRLRRLSLPAAPEPCALPLAACRIGRADSAPSQIEIGSWEHTWHPDDYGQAIRAVRAAIERGDVYQVNLVQHLSAPFRGNAAGLAERLAPLDPLHPAPLEGDGWAVVSASPEALPPAAGPHAHHATDQGDATARRRGRAARLRKGRGRAHDDRRPRAQRPRACV